MKKAVLWATLAVLLLITGCASVAPVAAVGASEVQDEAQAPAATNSRPLAPAPPDSYRVDIPDHIGATGSPQLVEFFAFWCSTCRYMRPTVHALEAEFWKKLDFVYLDIDDAGNQKTMDDFGFVAQPLFVLLDAEGNELQRWYGVVDEEDLRIAFNAAIES